MFTGIEDAPTVVEALFLLIGLSQKRVYCGRSAYLGVLYFLKLKLAMEVAPWGEVGAERRKDAVVKESALPKYYCQASARDRIEKELPSPHRGARVVSKILAPKVVRNDLEDLLYTVE